MKKLSLFSALPFVLRDPGIVSFALSIVFRLPVRLLHQSDGLAGPYRGQWKVRRIVSVAAGYEGSTTHSSEFVIKRELYFPGWCEGLTFF